MTIELEQLEMIRERANVSYAEAKEALEKNNYNTVEALIYLEQQNKEIKKKDNVAKSSFLNTVEKIIAAAEKAIRKGNEIKFVMTKAGRTVMDLPLNVVIVATIIFPPLTIIGILVSLFANHKIRFVKPDAIQKPQSEKYIGLPPGAQQEIEA